MSGRGVVLRKTSDAGGLRHLKARLSQDGVLTIEGHDLGKAVEDFFGVREYEWAWTIAPAEVERLAAALGVSNVLTGLHERFSGDDAAGLQPFLDEQGIEYEPWSRMGD